MNVLLSIECMDSMMNVREDLILRFGNHLQIVLIVFLYVLLLMKKSFVCMEGYPLVFLIYLFKEITSME